jgi:hypothetical protein
MNARINKKELMASKTPTTQEEGSRSRKGGKK